MNKYEQKSISKVDTFMGIMCMFIDELNVQDFCDCVVSALIDLILNKVPTNLAYEFVDVLASQLRDAIHDLSKPNETIN